MQTYAEIVLITIPSFWYFRYVDMGMGFCINKLTLYLWSQFHHYELTDTARTT